MLEFNKVLTAFTLEIFLIDDLIKIIWNDSSLKKQKKLMI